jgi:Flp pilus assembly protein TadG
LLVKRGRDEAGAIAVVTALMATMLLIVSALAVDLGNTYAHKRDRQKDSDLATLAGAGVAGKNLPATSGGACATAEYTGPRASAGDQAVKDVATYLTKQLGTNITAAQLTDCKVTSNGEVFYGVPKKNTTGSWSLTANKNQLSLVSPPDHVDFGLANVFGFSGTDVNGVSTVEIRSPKFSTLPFYAFDGCDYGPQTLQQPNNGQSATLINLYAGTEPSPANQNNATLTSVTPNAYPAGTATGTLQPIDIAGTNFTGVTDVGFFESGNAVPGPVPVSANATSTPFTINAAGTQIHFNDLPDATRGVTGVQQFWYIRVKKNNQWSAVYIGNGNNQTLNAPKLTIGTPPLLCGQGSSTGNFGTLLLSHAPYSGWDDVGAANVALGLTNTLAIYPPGGPADGTCSSAQTTTVLWPTDGTNCVDTDTGMSAKVATGGFLGKGSSAVAGNQYLLKPRNLTKCANGYTAEATTVQYTQTINNDVLTCFFTDNSTQIADVIDENYPGPPLISASIYDSPRFGYVPVLKIQPAPGGSNKYQIIDFRPCFITDQPPSAIKGDGPLYTSGNSINGITTDNNGVKSVQVIFLDADALPNPPVKNGTVNYTGSGQKIPLLVN